MEEEISQVEQEKDNIHEPMVITADTQEPTSEIEASPKVNDEKKPMDITVATQETAVSVEVDEENKEIMVKPTDEATVTQEPTTEVGKFRPQEDATPLVDDACGRMSGLVEGWNFEKLLLLAELQKWKQLELSLQQGVIPLNVHNNMMDSLQAKWLKEEWERKEEAWRHRKIIKEKDEQLYQLHWEVSDLMFYKNKLRDLTLNLLACRRSSLSYPMFLWECYYLFQLREVYEKRSYLGSFTRTFLEIFHSCDFDDPNLLCELFLHNMMCEYLSTKMVATILSFMGDL